MTHSTRMDWLACPIRRAGLAIPDVAGTIREWFYWLTRLHQDGTRVSSDAPGHVKMTWRDRFGNVLEEVLARALTWIKFIATALGILSPAQLKLSDGFFLPSSMDPFHLLAPTSSLSTPIHTIQKYHGQAESNVDLLGIIQNSFSGWCWS